MSFNFIAFLEIAFDHTVILLHSKMAKIKNGKKAPLEIFFITREDARAEFLDLLQIFSYKKRKCKIT